MIDHTGIGVADVGRASAFYDAALGALGLRRVMQLPKSSGTDGIGYGVDYPAFGIPPQVIRAATTRHSYWIPMVTTWKRYSAKAKAARAGWLCRSW